MEKEKASRLTSTVNSDANIFELELEHKVTKSLVNKLKSKKTPDFVIATPIFTNQLFFASTPL